MRLIGTPFIHRMTDKMANTSVHDQRLYKAQHRKKRVCECGTVLSRHNQLDQCIECKPSTVPGWLR